MLPEALSARGTLRDGVTPAVPEEQYTFFTAQIAGSLAVEMHHTVAPKLNGIVGRNHLRASWALRFSHLLCQRERHSTSRPLVNSRSDQYDGRQPRQPRCPRPVTCEAR